MLIRDLSGNGVNDGTLVLKERSRDHPFTELYTVVPSDTVDIKRHGKPDPCRGLILGADGTIVYIPVGQTTPVTTDAKQGVFPVAVKRVLATGTSDIVIQAGY